jgi:hypothetical protein
MRGSFYQNGGGAPQSPHQVMYIAILLQSSKYEVIKNKVPHKVDTIMNQQMIKMQQLGIRQSSRKQPTSLSVEIMCVTPQISAYLAMLHKH